MKFVGTSALMNNPGNRGAYSEAIQSNAGKGRNSANFALITLERCCKMTHFVYHLRTNAWNRQLYSDCRVFPEGGGGGGGGGRYWSCFMENKMAVLHFKDNKFGISRYKRKKCFIRSVLLILVKNYSQRTALFDVPTILPLLVLGAVKRKPSSLFRNWGSAPSSNTETLSSEESLSYSESWSGLEIPDEDPSFLSLSCGTSLPQFTVNSTLDSRFTDSYYQKSRLTAITKLTFHEE